MKKAKPKTKPNIQTSHATPSRSKRPGATMGDMGNLRDELAEESKPRAGRGRR